MSLPLVEVDFEVEDGHLLLIVLLVDEALLDLLLQVISLPLEVFEVFNCVSPFEVVCEDLLNGVEEIASVGAGSVLVECIDGVVSLAHHGREHKHLIV